jgi:F-type H+-transporting ATPase subunit a
MTFLAEQPPVTHPTVNLLPGVCPDSNVLCSVSWDSLISSAIAIAVTLLVMLVISSRMSPGVPGKIQVWVETFYGFVRGQQHHIDENATFIVPLAMTIFFYILIANWIAFLPLPAPIHPATSDFNQTLAMGVLVFLVVEWYSLKVLGVKGFFRRFTKPFDLPPWLQPARYTIFLLINVIEEITKPLTLALRLFGNIFGGLVMLWVLTALVPLIPVPVVPGVSTVLSILLVAVWKAFDVGFIGLIQAFIFAFLTIVYFELAREGLEEQSHAQAAHQ